MQYPHVFQPIQIGSKRAKNRIETAPAAPFLASHTGGLSPEFYAYNEELAASGAGVVTLGVTSVDHGHGVGSRIMTIDSVLFNSDFGALADLFHRYGALASAELVHSRYMLSPADKVVNGTTTEEVEEVITLFADAAERLVHTGFDIAFVHGGHGNVPSMFFSARHNHRTDRFGGSFEGRCRFAVELLEAIRNRVGDKLALEYRLSAEEILPGGTTFEETLAFAKVIEPYIDLLHVSRSLLGEEQLIPFINPPMYLPRGINAPFAAEFKKELSIPVSVVGGMDLDTAEEVIASGAADMASMIRTIYADTRCLEKARLGKEDQIRPCIRCNTCINRTHNHLLEVRCAVNPLVGRETHIPARTAIDTTYRISADARADEPANVAVIGGGPAGLEACRVLACRGFHPVLFEKAESFGGQLALAAANPDKADVARYLDWSIRNVENDPRIEVRLGTEATPELVGQLNPKAVFLACGVAPNIPAFAQNAPLPVYWSGDVESGKVDPCGHVAVVGGGVTGMECALSLAHSGHEVTIVHPHPEEEMGIGATGINLTCLKALLKEAGVTFACNRRVDAVTADGVQVHDEAGVSSVIPCDSVVHALGFHTDEDLLACYEAAFATCVRIGDCAVEGKSGQRNVFHATQSAFDAAMML